MTIQDLSSIIKPYACEFPLKALAGRAVAVDASNWIYVNWKVAAKVIINRTNLIQQDPDTDAIRKQWFGIAWRSIVRFLQNGIYPVFVFDGAPPAEKGAVLNKRMEDKRKKQQEYAAALMQVRASADILDVASVPMDKLRKLCMESDTIDRNEMDFIRLLLDAMGFLTVKPNCEAERFCSLLCLEGHVAAVFSEDGDCIAHRCPVWIREINQRVNEEGIFDVATCYVYNNVLQGLQLNEAQFLDLCIMLGCDYNHRIHGVGPKKAEKNIRAYHSIDNIAYYMDVSCLNHVRCRELFAYVPSYTFVEEPFQITWKEPLEREVLNYYLDMFEANIVYSQIRDGLEYVKHCIMTLNQG